MVALRKRPPEPMTLTEFLAWEPKDRSGRTWQLIDGEPLAMAPGNETHGAIQNEIAALLRNHLLERDSPCRSITEPGIVPQTGASRNYRVPDIGVTCAPPSDGDALPEPVLLVEIPSPSNAKATRPNVWANTTIPSVREITVVHSTRIEAELLRRRPDGNWPDGPQIFGPGDTLTLSSIDFVAPLSLLYRTTIFATR